MFIDPAYASGMLESELGERKRSQWKRSWSERPTQFTVYSFAHAFILEALTPIFRS